MKLIDKDAAVEEIVRRLRKYEKEYDELAKYEVWITAKEIEHRIQGLKESLSILDTLEVKEVDLEKSISDWLFEGLPNDEDEIDYIKETAKHFFELGLKAQKGEEL